MAKLRKWRGPVRNSCIDACVPLLPRALRRRPRRLWWHSVLLRANIPTAIAATLVNTPPTFGPVYYAAWRVGSWMLGEEADVANAPQALRQAQAGAAAEAADSAATFCAAGWGVVTT